MRSSDCPSGFSSCRFSNNFMSICPHVLSVTGTFYISFQKTFSKKTRIFFFSNYITSPPYTWLARNAGRRNRYHGSLVIISTEEVIRSSCSRAKKVVDWFRWIFLWSFGLVKVWLTFGSDPAYIPHLCAELWTRKPDHRAEDRFTLYGVCVRRFTK